MSGEQWEGVLDEQLRESLTELKTGQAALQSGLQAMHLETNGRLARLETRVDRSLQDGAEINERLRKVETAEHVSVDWMKKVEERTEKNSGRIEALGWATAAWLLGLLATIAKGWFAWFTSAGVGK